METTISRGYVSFRECIQQLSNILIFNTTGQETKNSSAKKVASYQLSEDRAAMALAWDAPPDAVGADTVTLAKIGRRMGSDGSDGSGKI